MVRTPLFQKYLTATRHCDDLVSEIQHLVTKHHDALRADHDGAYFHHSHALHCLHRNSAISTFLP